MNICLDVAKKEKAMLIKDNEGDQEICIACWEGLKKGEPPIRGTQYLNRYFAMDRCVVQESWILLLGGSALNAF